MNIFEKLDNLEKVCLEIKKEEVSGMIFLSDKMLQHILSATSDNFTKLEWITQIVRSIKHSGADEPELITMSNSLSELSLGMFRDDDLWLD